MPDIKVIDIAALAPGTRAEQDYYHESGTILFHAGEEMGPTELGLLARHGIRRLFAPTDESTLGQFLRAARNQLLKVDDLEEDKSLANPLIDQDGNLLLKEQATVTRSLKDKLKARNIHTVFIRKSKEERKLSQIEAYQADVIAVQRQAREFNKEAPKWDPAQDLAQEDMVADPARLNPATLDQSLKDMDLEVPAQGPALRDSLVSVDPRRLRDDGAKRGFETMYRESAGRIFGMLEGLRDKGTIAGAEVGALSKVFINSLVKDRSLLLNLANLKSLENYEANHAINVTLIAVNIGTALGMGAKQVLELAYCAFLHDVGMLKVPQHILRKPGALTTIERMEIEKHPIYAINVLQKVSALPGTVPVVVYQEHERADKSGYPRARPGNLIHRYARIISVADVYDALTSPRPWRGPYLPYHAMETLLQMVSKKKFDPVIMRAFLSFAGLFPVGSFLELSDGSRAKVIEANGTQYTRPKVRVIWRDGTRADEPELIDLTTHAGLKVVRPVDPREVKDAHDIMMGF